MSYHKARVTLIVLFIGALVVQVLAIGLTYNKGLITDGDFVNVLLKLLAIYGVHLTIIIGGIIAQVQDEKANPRKQKVPSTAFWVALTLASLWNLLLVWRSVKFGLAAYDENSEDNVDLLTNFIEKIAAGGSFLVTGFLAFFFAKRDKS
jgi:hypothetical protein